MSREQLEKWKPPHFPLSVVAKVTTSDGNCFANGIHIVLYLQKGLTVSGEYCSTLLHQLWSVATTECRVNIIGIVSSRQHTALLICCYEPIGQFGFEIIDQPTNDFTIPPHLGLWRVSQHLKNDKNETKKIETKWDKTKQKKNGWAEICLWQSHHRYPHYLSSGADNSHIIDPLITYLLVLTIVTPQIPPLPVFCWCWQ